MKNRLVTAGLVSLTVIGPLACGSSAVATTAGSNGPDGGMESDGGGPMAPTCPGFAGRFGTQPEGAVFCESDKKTADICKNGHWAKVLSCADSTIKDTAGFVKSCECFTHYSVPDPTGSNYPSGASCGYYGLDD